MPEQETPSHPTPPPDQLHQLLRLVQPKRWLILFIIFILFTAFIIWAFLGRVPIEVIGRGVALSSEGVFSIEAKASGNVTAIHVKKGDLLDPSTLVMTIYNPILKGIISHIRTTQFKIHRLNEELKILKVSLHDKEELFAKGLIAKTIVSDAKAMVIDKEVAIEESKSALSGYFSDLEKNSSCAKEEIEKKELQFNEQNDEELFKLESCLSQVFSQKPGKVLEILVNVGANIDVKEPLVWMEHPTSENEQMIFLCVVPIQTVGRIRPGMQVQIEPTTVNPQEYGAMLGTVKEVSDFAVSEKELMNTLHNTQLVNYLFAGAPAVLQLTVELELNNKTPSGYSWTSGEGPPYKISTGTVGTIKVLVEEQRPISYLIPLWKFKPTS